MCDINTDGQRTIDNFGHLPEESLNALRDSLALTMQYTQLCSCSAYYRSVHRDPSVEELCLIDAYLSAYDMRSAQTATLSSLTSADAEIAAMLHSLIEQSKTSGGMMPPLTLSNALSASRTKTKRASLADAKTGARFCWVTDEEYGTLSLQGSMPVQSVCIAKTGMRLVLAAPTKPHQGTQPHTGELIALLALPKGADEAYYAQLLECLNDRENRRHIHGACVCPQGELLALLLAMSPSGCYADVSVLDQKNDDTSLFEIAAQARGYLIRADEAGMKELLRRMRACGLELTVFARLCNDGRLTMARRDALLASVSATLLHSLVRGRAVSLELCATPFCAAPMENKCSLVSACNSWERITAHPAGEPVTLGAYTVMHTTLPLQDALSPYDVRRAIMQCALELTAAGGDFSTLSAAVALSVGKQGSPCALWSAVLGVHSMLDEWQISSLAPMIKNSAEPTGTLTVCLFARTITPPKAAITPTQLRLFALRANDSGMVDQKELRAMLSLTSLSLADGHIAGLRPLWDRVLGKALTTVKDLTLTDQIQQAPALLGQTVFGLFVRADESVMHGTHLGSLAPAEQPHAAKSPARALIQTPERYSLVHRLRPTVLFPLLPTVDRPDTLIAYLGSLDADVRLLPLALTHEGCTALADALTDADIVILNGDAQTLGAVLEHRRVAYAMARHLTERDGTLIAVHGAAEAVAHAQLTKECSDANRLLLCPDGLTRDMLALSAAYYR